MCRGGHRCASQPCRVCVCVSVRALAADGAGGLFFAIGDYVIGAEAFLQLAGEGSLGTGCLCKRRFRVEQR